MKKFLLSVLFCLCACLCFGQESFGDFEYISTYGGKTAKDEEYTVMLYADNTFYYVSLYGYTSYDDFVEVYYDTKDLESAAFVYHQAIDCCKEWDSTFADLVYQCSLLEKSYSVSIYQNDSGATGLYYRIAYNSFLDFFR